MSVYIPFYYWVGAGFTACCLLVGLAAVVTYTITKLVSAKKDAKLFWEFLDWKRMGMPGRRDKGGAV